VCKQTGATLKHVRLTESEEIDLQDLAEKVTPKTKLVALVHVSNMLGCILPTQEAAEIAHAAGAKLFLDCCQSVPHMPVDVQVCFHCSFCMFCRWHRLATLPYVECMEESAIAGSRAQS
jgi:selenocysteine lyase/cysteine desulfurase